MFLINKLCAGPALPPLHKFIMPKLECPFWTHTLLFLVCFCLPGIGNAPIIIYTVNDTLPLDFFCCRNKADALYDNVTSQGIHMLVYKKESSYQEVIPAFVSGQTQVRYGWHMTTQWTHKQSQGYAFLLDTGAASDLSGAYIRKSFENWILKPRVEVIRATSNAALFISVAGKGSAFHHYSQCMLNHRSFIRKYETQYTDVRWKLFANVL